MNNIITPVNLYDNSYQSLGVKQQLLTHFILKNVFFWLMIARQNDNIATDYIGWIH
jgi:hypothetical protein